MQEIPIDKFRDNIEKYADLAILNNEPFRVNCETDKNFIVVSAEEWERNQETLYVLQNTSLMNQLLKSNETHNTRMVIE